MTEQLTRDEIIALRKRALSLMQFGSVGAFTAAGMVAVAIVSGAIWGDAARHMQTAMVSLAVAFQLVGFGWDRWLVRQVPAELQDGRDSQRNPKDKP